MKRDKDPYHSYSIYMEQSSPYKQAINMVNSIEYTIGDILFQDNNINSLKDTMVHKLNVKDIGDSMMEDG